MSKKKPSSTSPGTTVNPGAQPAAVATPVAPPQPAKAKTTAGPASLPVPATDAAEFDEQSAIAQLASSINIGSESDEISFGGLLEGSTKGGKRRTADRTPVAEDEPAEDQDNTGEEAADADATGDNPNEEETSDSSQDPNADPNPETEADPNADPEADAQAEAEDEPAGDDEDTRKWPKSYLRRVNKLTEKLERMDERLQSLQDENDRLKETPAAESGAAPVHAVTSEEARLQTEIERCEATLDFIDDNPQGAQTPDGRQWSAEELRKQRRQYERNLREAEDNLRTVKRKRTERAEAIQSMLVERHPFMKDRANPMRARVEEIVRQYPAFRDIPEARMMIADHLVLQQLLNRAAAGKANGNGNGHGNAERGARNAENGTAAGTTRPAPAPPRPAARAPGRPGAAPLPVNGQRSNLRKTEQLFHESGDPVAGKALLESLLPDLG